MTHGSNFFLILNQKFKKKKKKRKTKSEEEGFVSQVCYLFFITFAFFISDSGMSFLHHIVMVDTFSMEPNNNITKAKQNNGSL